MKIANPTSGIWHIMIDAFASFNGVTLEGYSRGLTLSNLSATEGGALYYEINVPEGV